MQEVIHIGFSKSASTFLQSLFDDIENVNYTYKSKRFSLLDEPKTEYKPLEDGLNIESDEHIILPSYSTRLNTKGTIIKDVKKIIIKIHDHNPDAKLILVIRNQVDLIRSRYSQYVLGGGKKSLNEFVKVLAGYKNNSEDFYQNYYYQIISFIEELFGQDQLLVIFYEDLKSNKEEIISNLESYIECKVSWNPSNIFSRRKGLSDKGIELLRSLNELVIENNKDYRGNIKAKVPAFIYTNLVRVLRGLDFYFPNSSESVELSPKLKDFIINKFRQDNELLSNHFERNLKDLGYIY